MNRATFIRSSVLLLALGTAACGGPEPADTSTEETRASQAAIAAARNTARRPTGEPLVTALVPLPGMEAEVPEITDVQTVLFRTTAGDVTIEVYPEAAPNAAARFIELVESQYYDNTPVSRVVPGFVAQFGINWRALHRNWMDRNFADDPTLFALERGTLAFAKAGPNTNSTQVFINYDENNRLAAPQLNFTAFGAVVSGMDIVDSFIQVGDPSGGLDQGELRENGDSYLASLQVKPTMILSATVL
jgi:cyclophilin family peptidyl-prolyl cis-trans isomerase